MVGPRRPTWARRRRCGFARLGRSYPTARRLRCALAMRVARTMPMRLGPYLLTECIGIGGMAAVYRARRRGTSGFETSVVVKTLLPEHRKNQRYVRMFKDEARLSAQLAHAHVGGVHDFGMLPDT